MLRKYGLFKYLFPFTDQGISADVDGMPERALQNTDKRIKQGKPVIPAFLFACMMWDPVKADARILMRDGTPEAQAWRIAMNDGLRDQNQYVAVPRRLAEIILDIWNIQFRLVKRNPRMVKACLNNRRFRAAYDFLLLRTTLHEVDEEIGEWWTRIQEVDPEQRDQMIVELGKKYKSERSDQPGNGQSNGNSVDYDEVQPSHNRSDIGRPGRGKSAHNKKHGGQKRHSNRGRNKSNRRTASNGSGNSNQFGNSNGNSAGNSLGNRSGGASANSGNGRKRGGAKRRRGPARAEAGRLDSAYINARPKDEYGNHTPTSSVKSENKQKKVKVRRKRRIVDPNASSESDTKPVV
jgi:poly(A) polymerase